MRGERGCGHTELGGVVTLYGICYEGEGSVHLVTSVTTCWHILGAWECVLCEDEGVGVRGEGVSVRVYVCKGVGHALSQGSNLFFHKDTPSLQTVDTVHMDQNGRPGYRMRGEG